MAFTIVVLLTDSTCGYVYLLLLPINMLAPFMINALFAVSLDKWSKQIIQLMD